MVYPHKWSPISCRPSTGKQKHAGQGPMFYHWTMQSTIFTFALQHKPYNRTALSKALL